MLNISTTAKLNNGLEIPLLGLGTWQASEGEEAYNSVRYALDAGYRHIDTARMYQNERSVGKAIRDSAISREEIWLTTKLLLLPGMDADQMFEDSFKMLDIGYVDLLLIHFPSPFVVKSNWKKLEKIYSLGTVRSLGVSNHSIKQIEDVMSISEVTPVLNQIKCSPYNYDSKIHSFLREKEMYLQAYSPLTRGKKLNDASLVEIASRYDKTTAQILIRWCLQKDIIVIPKSSNKDRIIQNASVYDFEISDEDMSALESFR